MTRRLPPSPPHLVVDARLVHHSGIGTYLRNLLPRLIGARPDWRFTLLGPSAPLAALISDVAAQSQVAIVESTAPLYSIAEQFDLPRLVPDDADLFWTPHYVIPVALRARMLVTVQDVFHLAMPELVGGMHRRLYARLMFGAVQRRATRLLFTSDFTRAEFGRLVAQSAPIPPSTVVPLGVSAGWIAKGATQPSPLDEPYLLYVGNVKPHKNVAALLRAFGRIASAVPHSLAIVGRLEGMRTGDPETRRLANDLPERVRLIGEVSQLELAAWLAHAHTFAFPSLYEGFGLPPLESMIAGCPCLVARTASLPEVCGDAAHYCDPRDESDLADRLLELMTDESLRARLRERGRQRAAQYTWERCAAGTIAAIEEALTA